MKKLTPHQMKIGAAVLSGILALVLFCVYRIPSLIPEYRREAKLFRESGLEITLTESFRKVDFSGYTVCFESRNVAVFALREPFSATDNAADLSAEQYAGLIVSTQGEADVEIQTEDGLCFFEYNAKTEKDAYGYFAAAYKEKGAFWLIQFAVKEDSYADYRDSFLLWAKSVRFS